VFGAWLQFGAVTCSRTTECRKHTLPNGDHFSSRSCENSAMNDEANAQSVDNDIAEKTCVTDDNAVGLGHVPCPDAKALKQPAASSSCSTGACTLCTHATTIVRRCGLFRLTKRAMLLLPSNKLANAELTSSSGLACARLTMAQQRRAAQQHDVHTSKVPIHMHDLNCAFTCLT
jgi:hypothetical protein